MPRARLLEPIRAHYANVTLPGHHGETRDERLAEFARVNPGLPVIGLPEGDWLRVSGSSIKLRGAHPAAWFHGEKAPTRIDPGPDALRRPVMEPQLLKFAENALGSRAPRG